MKYFAYIAVLACAILALATAEPLNRVQRSPAPIAAPEPNSYYGYPGYTIGQTYGYGQDFGYNRGYGYGQNYGLGQYNGGFWR